MMFLAGCGARSMAAAFENWDSLRAALAGERAGLSLSFYEGWGWVTDARQLALASGEQVVRFAGVPSRVERGFLQIPGTVRRSRVRFDLRTKEQLLERFAGKTVDVWLPNATESVPAILLWSESGPMFKVGNRIYPEVQRVALPDADLATEPLLEWQVSAGAWSGVATASYLVNGLAWSSDYLLETDRGQTRGDWKHWANLANRSGGDFRDAMVTLIAGEVRRDQVFDRMERMAPMAPVAAGASFAAVPFAGRYQYVLGKLTLLRNTEERVLLGESLGIPVRRTFRIESALGGDPELPRKPRIRLSLTLSKPAPRGKVTVLSPDPSGKLAVIGEPTIPDSPSGQPILLDLGEAFDLTVDRKQTNQRIVGEDREISYRLILRNQLDEAATIEVVENFYGDWTIEESSQPYEKLSATQALFRPRIPAKGEVTLTYRVLLKRDRPKILPE
ncbi:MAG: DUF4139 domain-containing protein [Bacteroidota bacterium]